MVERICTTRPPVSNREIATLMANQWVYLDRKRVQIVNAGYGKLTEGL